MHSSMLKYYPTVLSIQLCMTSPKLKTLNSSAPQPVAKLCSVFLQLRWIVSSNFIQLCEYSDHSKFYVFSLAPLPVATLFQLVHMNVFSDLFFSLCCSLTQRNVYATADLKEVFWCWCTEGTGGRKWLWDEIQWWRANLTQMSCRKTVCDAGENYASSSREVEMTLSQNCCKTSVFLLRHRVKTRLLK